MLSWTKAGAVERPSIVQIRVQRSYPGRIRAGAPVPTRSMSTDEVLRNVRRFTLGQQGPRTQPCKGLVLSGIGVASREDTPQVLRAARQWGVQWVVLHAGGEDLEHFDAATWSDLVDVLVVALQPVEIGGGLVAGSRAVAACRDAGIRVAVNTVLNWRGVDNLRAVARSISRVRPDEVTFTYPFPINGNDGTSPPPIPRTLVALREALSLLQNADIRPRVKGLPACYLGENRLSLGRSANRWYVDADHQLGDALMFFPEVVAFHKEEICRFCAVDAECDGFFATYLRRPGFPPLSPLASASDDP